MPRVGALPRARAIPQASLRQARRLARVLVSQTFTASQQRIISRWLSVSDQLGDFSLLFLLTILIKYYNNLHLFGELYCYCDNNKHMRQEEKEKVKCFIE